MKTSERMVLSAGLLALLAGAPASAQFAEPTPQSALLDGTVFVDPFTGLAADFLAPSTGANWPGTTVAGANYLFFGYVDDDGDNVVDLGDTVDPESNFAILDSSQGGPIAFSATRHDAGDIDPTFGLAAPADPLSYLDAPTYADTSLGLALMLNGQSLLDVGGQGEVRNANGQLSLNTGGLPAYGWKPDVAQGVMMLQSISNGIAPPLPPSPSIPVDDITVPMTGDLTADYQALVSGTSGLQNYWSFEDAAPGGALSTVVDSASGDDGTAIGVVNSVAGLIGNTGSFIGDTDDSINTNVIEITGSGADSDFDLQGSFTVEALIRADDFASRFATIISRGDNSWRLSPDTNEGTGAIEPSANGLAGSTTNRFINTENGEWHYVAFVVDSAAGVQTAWVNNVRVDESFAPGLNVDLSTFDVLIGGNAQRADREFIGEIDEVAIYTRALTQTEVLQRVKLLGTDVDLAPFAPTSYLIPNVVANSADRTGVGYSMINGNWGDANADARPNAIRFQLSGFGDVGERSMPFAAAWFPYEQGWIGGFHTPKGLEYRHAPIFTVNTAENTGPTTDPAEIDAFFRLPPTEQIGPVTAGWLIQASSGVTSIVDVFETATFADFGLTDPGFTNDFALFFEGTVTIDSAGDYFFGVEADDNGQIDVFLDGAWVNVVGRRNSGGCDLFEGGVNLDAGTYPVRVRYSQRGGGGCLSVFLDSEFTFGEPLVFDAPGATVALYDLDLFDARSDRYVGLIDENTDGVADYGLGTWRIENISRASAHRSLIDNPDAVKYLPDPNGSGDNGLHGRVRFDLPGLTPEEGMLFVQGNESSGANTWVGLLPSQPGDTHWEAHIRRNNDTEQFEEVDGAIVPRNDADSIASLGSSNHSFLFVPWIARGLVGATVLDDGSVAHSKGSFSVSRTDTGSYELTIPGKTGADGMILIQAVGVSPFDSAFATRATFSYEYNAGTGAFELEARQWIPGDDGGTYNRDLNDYALVDTGFNFVWVDFTNPVSSCEVDVNFDANVDFFDMSSVLNGGGDGEAFADRDGNGLFEQADVQLFETELTSGCPGKD